MEMVDETKLDVEVASAAACEFTVAVVAAALSELAVSSPMVVVLVGVTVS